MRIPPTTARSRSALFGATLVLAMAGARAKAAEPVEPQGAATTLVAATDEVAPEESQPVPPPSALSDIEVITIRGRHHDDLLQDTAVSVTSFNTKELEDLRIQDIGDLAEYTPNLDIKSRSAASNPTLFIRGIGLKDYNANSAGAVAIYQDGININAPAIQLFQLFDVESIEVLRGPQGVYGRNATAGAIKVNSVKPDGVFGATASFTYGNYNTLEGEGAISLPLIDEMLSARLAFTASFADGNTDNECANWDPESIGLPRLTEQTIRDAWAAEIADGQRPPPPRYPFGEGNAFDAQGRPLEPDEVCITEPAGFLRVGTIANPINPPIWESVKSFNPSARTYEDFQGLEERVNDVNNWAARGLLRFQPFGEMDWLLNAHGGQNRSGSRHLQMLGAEPVLGRNVLAESIAPQSEALAILNYQQHGGIGRESVEVVDGLFSLGSNNANLTPGGLGGGDPFSGWYDSDGTEYLDAYGVSLRGTWELGRAVVTSLSGYEWYDRLVEDEGDATPEASFPGDYSDSAWQVSQELRVEGEGERHRWSIGGFFLQEKLTAFNFFPTTQNFEIEQFFDQKLWSLAPYAGGRYELTEELGLESGVRYNVEHKDFTLASTVIGTGENAGSFPTIPEQQVSDTWTGVTGDATLSYAPLWSVLDEIRNDNLNLYAKYSRGMKGGHFNAGLTIKGSSAEQRVAPVEPEFVHAVEVGFKSGWLDNRLVVNVAGFRYWYKDLQVFDIINAAGELPLQQLLNSDARVLGAEVELQARPLPGLSIQAGFGWLDTGFGTFTVTKAVSQRRGTAGQASFDYSGNPLISAPRYSLSVIVDYEIPLSGFGSLIPQYDFSWRSKAYFDPAELDPISQEPYWLHNARLAYRTPDGRIEVAGWVQNFMNEFYKTDAFDLSLQYASVLEVWGDPRTYGLTVTYSW